MNKKVTKRLLSLMLSFVMVLSCVPATAFAVAAAETIDVALYATPSTDAVSSWENLNGINNNDFNPTSSNVGTGYGWGNWSQSVGSEHWLQYDWSSAITTDTFQVYWYHDGGGTQIPSAIRFQYKDESGAWKDLEMVSALNDVLGLNTYNTIKVAPVTTTAIRFNQTVREGAAANGVYRWKVMSELTDSTADMVLNYAKNNLTLSDRMSTDTQLITSMVNGVTVDWTENHSAIVIQNGKAIVTRGTADVNGTLTATLSINGKTVTKQFNVVVPAATEAIPNMLAKYDFSELNGSLAAGTTLVDASGHDNNATVYGSGVTASNDALVLPGGSAYVQLPTGMFDGQDNLTISMWIQNDNGANWTSAFFFGKNTTSYFMINPQNPTSQTAKVCLTWSGSQSEIGLSPGQNISAGPAIGSEWTHYTVVITPTSMNAYLNGEKYGTYALNRTISNMGTDLVSYIGRSLYSDPYFKGKVKNINIYSKAVSDAEVGALYTEGLTNQQILDNVANALSFPEVKNGILSTRLYDTLTLPESALSGLVNISWASDNSDILPVTGKVNAPEKDTTVKMTATLAVGDVTKDVAFDIVVLAKDSTSYSITMDMADTGIDISQQLFGLFYEDINSAADGGLATELVKNNSFENYADVATPSDNAGRGDQTSWKQNWTSSNGSNFVIEQTNGLNAKNTNYAKLTGSMTLSNNGFAARNNLNGNAISIENGTKYDFSMWMKAESSYRGKVSVKVVNAAGTALTDEQILELKKDGTWQKVETVLTGNTKAMGKLVLTFQEASVSDVIYIDMVSLNSQNTYGYGNKNYAYGAGLRKDLVETLMALKPSFIRFPGGCVVEGDMGTHGYFDWENSVGPLEERKATANYWSKHELNDYVSGYGYMMSYEFGYHEILTLCEDMGAEAFPILSAGIFCQFRNSADPIQVGDPRLDEFADKGVHLLDYCWGDPNSTDEQEAYWAGLRVQNGHEKPFDLKYMGIGNENWNEGKVNYFANFEYMREYIESYAKEHYPERKITIISSTGPYATGSMMDNAWKWIDSTMPGETLVDEHYYMALNWMLQNTHRYDYYDRLDEGGSNVFVGEYAVNSSINTLEAAIAEAAYMTGFERNGDIVRHASYAPLLCKLGSNNWSPNMIYFDEDEIMLSANYYTQWMYANNYGETLLNTDLSRMNKNGNYAALVNTQMDIYQVSSMNDDYIYLKLINHDDYVKDITLNYPGIDFADAEIICMTGPADAVNSLGNEVVAPVSTKAEVVNGKLLYDVPAMSFTVVKVAIGDAEIDVKVNKENLQNAINDAIPEAEAENYTEATWAAYAKALADAKAVLAKEDATQKEVNDAVRALANAQSALVIDSDNIALRATASGSFYSSWITQGFDAINDDIVTIPAGADGNANAWGTWGNTGASEYVQYNWDVPMKIIGSDLYIWDDNPNEPYVGIETPASLVYEYLPADSSEWITIATVQEGIVGGAAGELNSIIFETPVVAVALRVTLNKNMEAGSTSTNAGVGVTEWQVFGEEYKETPVQDLPYVDVAETDWFYNAAYYAYVEDIMTGIDETTFAPGLEMTRAQLALMLYRLADKPEYTKEAQFPDLEEGAWYLDAVNWATENDIISGYAQNGLFGPHDKVTREQAAVMLYRYAEYVGADTDAAADLSEYEDAASVSEWAKAAMQWAVGSGIITGRNGVLLAPQGTTSRAEGANIIYKYMN